MEAADSLQPVTVVADRGLVVSRTDTVDIVNSISITDAIGKASGLSVMDNGGASGLKTVSLRGLGSAHTAIYLDGVRVGNVQSGQTDLGMFDSESFSGIIVDYAQNSLFLVSAKPSSDRQKDINSLLQVLLRERFSPLYHLSVSAKASYDILNYFSEWGDSRYGQAEVQVNSSHKFSIAPWLDASVAADFLWDGLESTGYDSSRSTVTAVASASFHPGRFKADMAVEYSGIFDGPGKDFHLPKDLVLGLKFLARNLTDCRYELSSGYPMPGRAFFGEIVFKF